MKSKLKLYGIAMAALLSASSAHSQLNSQRADAGNRLNNPFRTQFKAAWTLPIQDPVKLVDVGAVTDSKRSNLVMLVTGKTSSDTQRKLRVLHWTGSSYVLDGELVTQSIGIDTLLLGKFHPGSPAPTIVPSKTVGSNAKPKKSSSPGPSKAMQVLTNTGIYSWYGSSLQPLFARQLPDVKQAIVLENRPDIVVVGSGDGATPFEFSQSEMKIAPNEKLQGAGYAHFGIGLQPYSGSETANLSPGIRFAQAAWSGRTKWLIGLIRGKAQATIEDPAATTGDRLIVYTPKFASRDKTFWETRMDDMEESWRSDPLPGRVLDVRVGDPHNDGKPGILVLTSENDDHDRRLVYFAVSGNG